MPASRAEIYVRNDGKMHKDSQFYVLRTKGLQGPHAGKDHWPEIQLARIELKPNFFASTIKVGLNAPVEQFPLKPQATYREEVKRPDGCVRDLEDAKEEYRRVTFNPKGMTSEGKKTDFSITTEIVHPSITDLDENQLADSSATVGPYPFEEYEQKDNLVDWTKKHVCIFIDHKDHKGSHKQLWVLDNETGLLHNFHIHQMKFRLATKKELEEHHIEPPPQSHICMASTDCRTPEPDYELYDSSENNSESKVRWHDTIPIPPGQRVFLIMSFDAEQQIGRFVFHCHILKHEDKGLMAPIEVWGPTRLLQ